MSRAPAPSRRPSSSRRGWLPHQQRASAPLAALRSEADPTGFQPLRSSPCFAKRRLHNRPGHAQSSGQGPEAGPFFDEYPRQGGVFTTSNSSTPDAERFAQVCSYQCS